MFRLLAFVLFTVTLMRSTECQSRAIAPSQPNLCINTTYIIALFGQKSLRMKMNRARLRQANVHTVRIRASISDPKVAQFSDHQQSISAVFRLANDTEGKCRIAAVKQGRNSLRTSIPLSSRISE